MTSSENVNIAVTCHIFTEYICGWLGSVRDWYVVEHGLIDERCQCLSTASILEAVNDSDGKKFSEALKHSNENENEFENETDFECF